MAWLVLILSGVVEAVWAIALSKSEGLTRPAPSLVFLAALGTSMVGLAYAMRQIPVGPCYAVWVGVGAALTVGYGMVFGAEQVSLLKMTFLAGIVGCVIGLKVVT